MDQSITVLIVDDDRAICEVLKNEFQLRGFTVYLAEDGKKALDIARKKKPDVILLDWVMPGQSGLETLSVLKKHRSTKNIPVFMVTSKVKLSEIDKAFDIGADDYITKPFVVYRMAEAIRQKLKKVMNKRTALV